MNLHKIYRTKIYKSYVKYALKLGLSKSGFAQALLDAYNSKQSFGVCLDTNNLVSAFIFDETPTPRLWTNIVMESIGV